MSPLEDQSRNERLEILIYQHLKSNVSVKLAGKFAKASNYDMEKKLPDGYATLSEIVLTFENTRMDISAPKDVSASEEGAKKLKAKKKAKTDKSDSELDYVVLSESVTEENDKSDLKRKQSFEDHEGEDSSSSKKRRMNNKSDDFSPRKGLNDRDKCRNCQKPGHFARDCPEENEMTCYNCQGVGHMSRDCPDKSKTICFNCKQSGHLSRDCPKENERSCYNCNKGGHIARDCPEEQTSRRSRDNSFRSRSSGSSRFNNNRRGRSNRSFGTGANSIALGPRKAPVSASE